MLEISFTIEDLDSKQCPGQWRPEGRADTGGNTGQQKDAPVSRGQSKLGRKPGTDTGTYLGDWAFTTGRSTGTDGYGRRHGLDPGNTAPNMPALVVKQINRSISAMPLCFGRIPVDQVTGYQAAKRREEE